MAKKKITERTLQIEYRSVEALIPYARNARRHDNLKELEESILRFGFIDPIGVDSTGTIVWGHGRLMAARNVGIETVPVIELPAHLSHDEIRAIRLAHNKLTETSGWIESVLAEELKELADLSQPIALLGFDDAEFERLTKHLNESASTALAAFAGGDDDDDEDEEDDEDSEDTSDDEPKQVVELGDPQPAAPEQPAPPPLPPGEKYAEFAVLMREDERTWLLERLAKIARQMDTEDTAAALLAVVRAYEVKE